MCPLFHPCPSFLRPPGKLVHVAQAAGEGGAAALEAAIRLHSFPDPLPEPLLPGAAAAAGDGGKATGAHTAAWAVAHQEL